MVDFKNEVAGVVAIGGFVSLVLALAGAATLLGVALGNGTGLGAVGGGLSTAIGVAGLLGVWAAIESGYFDPAATPVSEEPAVEDEAAETV